MHKNKVRKFGRVDGGAQMGSSCLDRKQVLGWEDTTKNRKRLDYRKKPCKELSSTLSPYDLVEDNNLDVRTNNSLEM